MSSEETTSSLSPPDVEISHKQALKNLLDDSELSDITLQGTDNVGVAANGCMLAARSPFFRSMLYGNFSEASHDTISLNYESRVLRAVVEYIYTDDCGILEMEKGSSNVDWARTIVGIVEAANYVGLPRLSRKAKRWASLRMATMPVFAGVFLETESAELHRLATECLRTQMLSLVQDKEINVVLSGLSAASLECILQDDKVEADDYTLFLFLNAWVESSLKDDNNNNDNNSRFEKGCELTKHLQLHRIDPSDLSTKVQQSGLVTVEQLCEAYKRQALYSQQKLGLSCKRPRLMRLVWESSQDIVFSCADDDCAPVELLQCPNPLRSGVHQWTILIEKTIRRNLGLGVASTIHPPVKTDWLGSDSGGWLVWSNGDIWHGLDEGGINSAVDLTFQKGSKVTMVLDLRHECGGTLSATIDQGERVRLFSGMLEHLRGSRDGGFVPALSTVGRGRVRLLGMTEMLP